MVLSYPIRPDLFSRSRGPEARIPNVKANVNRLKVCVSHYSHKSMHYAKFESGSRFSFGDMMSQNFPLEKRMSDQIRIFTPEK